MAILFRVIILVLLFCLWVYNLVTRHAYGGPIELGCSCQLCVAVECWTDNGNVENLSNHFVNTLHNFLSNARYTRMTEEVLSARHYHPTSHEWRSPDWYEEHKRPINSPDTFSFSRPNHVFFHFARADFHLFLFLLLSSYFLEVGHTTSTRSGIIRVHSNIRSASASKWERDDSIQISGQIWRDFQMFFWHGF